MTAFPNWQSFVVPQRHPESCIPWSYEIILRAHGVVGIAFDTFQDDFNLNQKGTLANFQNVAAAVHQRYPHVEFGVQGFVRGDGAKKLAFVESRIIAKQPTAISLSNEGLTGRQKDAGKYHIMPVVDADGSALYLLHAAALVGCGVLMQVLQLAKSDLVRIHDTIDGGNDVAFLAKP